MSTTCNRKSEQAGVLTGVCSENVRQMLMLQQAVHCHNHPMKGATASATHAPACPSLKLLDAQQDTCRGHAASLLLSMLPVTDPGV
jgi:hypothetical protein